MLNYGLGKAKVDWLPGLCVLYKLTGIMIPFLSASWSPNGNRTARQAQLCFMMKYRSCVMERLEQYKKILQPVENAVNSLDK